MGRFKVGKLIFDPETGEFTGGDLGSGPITLPESNRTHRNRLSMSIWGRFDAWISGIGNWFARNSEIITNMCAGVLVILAAIIFVIQVISTFVDDGLIWGLIVTIFGGGLFFYVVGFAAIIFIWIGNFTLAIVRYIFYSAYSFLTVIALLIFAAVMMHSPTSTPTQSNTPATQYTAPQTTQYYCTASTVLNIRSAPNTHSRILGVLRPKQVADVYEITNGFGKIKQGSRYGYVSLEYMQRGTP